MRKTWTICLAALLCCMMLTGACADSVTLSGTVIPAETVLIYAPASGTVESVNAEAGQKVYAGDILYTVKTTKIYAENDGKVTGVFGQPGDSADTVTTRYGAVLYVEEKNAYTVSASTNQAYSSVDTKLVHAGETVYLQCRSNADRKGKGIITAITENSYNVEVTEGSFIPGDSVEVYRDEARTNTQKVGRGTVSRRTPTAVTATGSIVRIAVKDGAEVKRGDLLLETVESTFDKYEMTGTEVAAGVTGIVGSISVQQGGTVQKDGVAAELYPLERMRVEATVTEDARNQIREGDSVTVELETDESKVYEGTVVLVSAIAAEGTEEVSYRVVVEFTPDEAVCFGMSALINAGEDEEPQAAEPADEPEEAAEAEPEAEAEAEAKETEGEKKRPEWGDGERPEFPDGERPEWTGSGERPERPGSRGQDGETPESGAAETEGTETPEQ